MDIQLSILTPAVPSRLKQLKTLCSQLADQIGSLPIEHLVLLDNKQRTVGEKRGALLRMARGQYVAFVDDDDAISHDYITLILEKIKKGPDVITFRQQADVNDVTRTIEFRLGNPNEAFEPYKPNDWELHVPNVPLIKRNAWHVCAWKRTLAIQSRFPASNYGEDWAYAAPLCAAAKTEEHIPKVLHFYRHSSATTEAPPP